MSRYYIEVEEIELPNMNIDEIITIEDTLQNVILHFTRYNLDHSELFWFNLDTDFFGCLLTENHLIELLTPALKLKQTEPIKILFRKFKIEKILTTINDK